MTRTRPTTRAGTIVPLLAVVVIALFSFVALAIDLGMLNIARTHAQNAADAAALAGSRKLNNKPSADDNDKDLAVTTATAAVDSSAFFTSTFVDDGTSQNKITVSPGLYDYDSTAGKFIFKPAPRSTADANKSWTAMQVTIAQSQGPYFSRILGVNSLDAHVIALAVHTPRDIAFALDFTGSMSNASTGNWGSSSLNADSRYPQFGHYQRFTGYSTDPNNSPTASTPASRPNPLYVNTNFRQASGEVSSANNFTVETPNGPAIVDDFYYDTSNSTTPATTATPVVVANLSAAFTRSPLPTADNYKDQSDNGTNIYSGDRWPRKGGQILTTSTSWDPTTSNGAAITAAEFLGWVSNYSSGASLPSTLPTAAASSGSGSSARSWANFRDTTWETYGYDLNVAYYIAHRNDGLANTAADNSAKWDPRWDPTATKDTDKNTRNPPTDSTFNVNSSKTDGKFKGYSMGPGYYGKTFFIWPPDPRYTSGADPTSPATTGPFAGVKDTSGNWICDWRRRFFLTTGSAAFNPQSGNVNTTLLKNGTGLTTIQANYKINYPAVLAWIKSGPSTLPPNLRAGRIVYYTSIPNNVTTSGSTAADYDKVFWKNYIDYVFGANTSWNTDAYLAGTEAKGWPEGVTPAISSTATAAYVSNYSGTSNVTDPLPYMTYTDNPSRPRSHFWFGPTTMIQFIQEMGSNTTYDFMPGTCHEAQCWQLKAAINSVLDDIRNNHPNDYVGINLWSQPSTLNQKIRAPMSQDWTTLKNSLFYPYTMVYSGTAASTPTTEVRPYNTSFNASTSPAVSANYPNACGYTDPNSGLAMAYNLLSSATTTSELTH
ncbi:MAG TPA: pilus assembly protein TadG-related protein, partial [Fimbriiglobus sp.]